MSEKDLEEFVKLLIPYVMKALKKERDFRMSVK